MIMKVKITGEMEDGLVIVETIEDPKFWSAIIRFYRNLEIRGYALDELEDLHYQVVGE
jgi:hypothetical protein